MLNKNEVLRIALASNIGGLIEEMERKIIESAKDGCFSTSIKLYKYDYSITEIELAKEYFTLGGFYCDYGIEISDYRKFEISWN